MKNLTFIVAFTIALIGCKSVDKIDESVYFGGQIVNPKNNYIVLMKDEKLIDTIRLGTNNRFSKRLKSINEGLYFFKHGPEFQYVYLAPKDSILIRLNTWDFDESLVFSGKGSEKNNFLINLYLQNEKNERSFSPFYNLKSEEFASKIATTQSINQHFYNQLVNSGVELTEKFKELAKVAVNYSLFRQKEIYPYIHRNRFQLEEYPELPDDYYSHRKGIDLNNEDLIHYHPYPNYVSSYLYSEVNRNRDENVSFTEQLLPIIIKNISIESFKNQLLFQAMYNDFREAEGSCAINQKAIKIFNKHCTDEGYKNQINSIADDCEKIKIKRPIENFEIATFDNTKTNLKKVIKNKKSVIYFWSPEIMNQDMLIKRVKRLNQKYPDLQFVGINMKPELDSRKAFKLLNNQYKLTKDSEAHKYIKSLEPRTILVDEQGITSNNFTYLSSQYLEKQLTKLSNN